MSETAAPPKYLLEGKYEIVGVVGEGAWGQVLEGINIRIRRKVAIKILKAEYASNPDMVGRFEREALASTHIESPHVVQVFDAGVLADGRPYLVMEFLTGEDLATHITRGGPLPVIAAVSLCAQVARGLAAAHAAGVFHRDMKPSNIVIATTKSGREIAKIVDFGISKLLDVSKPTISHTQTGTVLGSPVYMSPEQARGSKTTDHRSDIYSLGVVLYECLTGTTPHTADGFNELLFKIVLEEAPSSRNLRPEVDEDLDSILRRVLAKTPELRVQTASELEMLLVEWLAKHGTKLSDSPTDGGPRLPPGLVDSPIIGGRPLSSGQLLAARKKETPENLQATVPVASGSELLGDGSLPRLVDSELQIASGVAQTVPAPNESSGALNDAYRTTEKPARAPSWSTYVIGGAVALALLVGGIAVATRGSPTAVTPTGRTPDPSGHAIIPTASTSPSAAATAPAPDRSATAGTTTGSASSSASAVASAEREGPRAVVPRPLVPAVAASAVRPKPVASAGASAAAQPVASSAGSASVGGRTIRTDL